MSCTTYFAGDTFVHRLDPRGRIVVLLASALVLAAARHPAVPAGGLGAAVLLCLAARLPPSALLKRLAHLNAFVAVVAVVLPLTTGGPRIVLAPGLALSQPGLSLAALIALKANALVLAFTALLGTVELSALGHAFQQLGLPDRLVHLFLFTLRYLDVLHRETQSLLRAMRARAFRPRMTLHTYRAYAQMAGMLLVRSLVRSERVLAAMRCRGFTGRFHGYRSFAFRRGDFAFCGAAAAVLACFAALEWGR